MEVTTGTASHTPQFVALGVLVALIILIVFILRSKASRIIKYDINTLTTVFFMLGILVLVNVIPITMHQLTLGSVKIPLQGRKDFTLNQRNTISDDTINMLRDLNQDVTVTAFYNKGRPEEAAARDLFDQYQFYSPHFKYDFVDPLTDRLAALKYKDELRLINPTVATIIPGTVVLEMPPAEGAPALPGASPVPRRQSVQLPTAGKPGEAEVKLSQALYQLLHNDKRTLYFTEGHGENSPTGPAAPTTGLQVMKETLEKSQYTIKSFSLYKEGKVPTDADAVVVVGPTKDFEKTELDTLHKYLDGGGRVLMLIDPPASFPNLSGFLSDYGMQLGNDLVIDPGRGFEHKPDLPLIGMFAPNSPITNGYDIEVFFGLTRSLSPVAKTAPGIKADWIAKTWDDPTHPDTVPWALTGIDKGIPSGNIAFDPKKDTKGPITVGMASVIKPTPSPSPASPSPSASAKPSSTPEGRLVVYGDSQFIAGQFFLVAGNSDLFLRSVNWLAQPDNVHINIRPPMEQTKFTLTDTQRYRIWWISFVLVPGTIAMLGIVVFMLYKPN